MRPAGHLPAAARSQAVFGVRWDGRGRALVLALGVAVSMFAALLVAQASSARERSLTVVVMGDRSARAPERAVRAAGGSVRNVVRVVNGVVARVPAGSLASLRAAPGVRGAFVDRRFSTRSDDAADEEPLVTDDPVSAAARSDDDRGLSLAEIRRTIGADRLGTTGSGIDVALIDSGISPVAGLADAGKVLDGPDFSPDSADPDLNHLDAFGHGTHLAGIIAGNDDASGFAGVAPGARLVNVKAADAEGTTSLAQLLEAVDWVVQNRTADGLDIRVLTLAVGADNRYGYMREPLAWAVEQAWKSGIVVVTAAGNDGRPGRSPNGLNVPAADPYVLAIGGVDAQGTADPADDVMADWSSVGDGTRDPDLAAPGSVVVSLRVPGSFIDEMYPAARMGPTRFRGSGTSQAAAVTTGAVALLLADHPSWSPDTVKAALRGTARSLGADHSRQGEGSLDVAAADVAAPTDVVQTWPAARTPSRRALARRLRLDHQRGRDEINIWDGRRWSGRRWSGVKWSSVKWSGVKWSGVKWSGVKW
jgi:Subtilase family